MSKITEENIKDIEIKTNIKTWQLIPDFLLDLALKLGLTPGDVLDFLGLNKEQDPEKVQLNNIAELFISMSDDDKKSLFELPNFKALDFNTIEKKSLELKEKHERQSKCIDNFIPFINSLSTENTVYQKALFIVSSCTDKSINDLKDINPIFLIELIYKIFAQIENEALQGFFFIKVVKTLQISTILLSFINHVKLIIQKKSLMN